MMASPLSELRAIGAPDASVWMHFNSPTNGIGRGWMSPGERPGMLSKFGRPNLASHTVGCWPVKKISKLVSKHWCTQTSGTPSMVGQSASILHVRLVVVLQVPTPLMYTQCALVCILSVLAIWMMVLRVPSTITLGKIMIEPD